MQLSPSRRQLRNDFGPTGLYLPAFSGVDQVTWRVLTTLLSDTYNPLTRGEVSEWLIEHDRKSCARPKGVPRVQIPPSPPFPFVFIRADAGIPSCVPIAAGAPAIVVGTGRHRAFSCLFLLFAKSKKILAAKTPVRSGAPGRGLSALRYQSREDTARRTSRNPDRLHTRSPSTARHGSPAPGRGCRSLPHT